IPWDITRTVGVEARLVVGKADAYALISWSEDRRLQFPKAFKGRDSFASTIWRGDGSSAALKVMSTAAWGRQRCAFDLRSFTDGLSRPAAPEQMAHDAASVAASYPGVRMWIEVGAQFRVARTKGELQFVEM